MVRWLADGPNLEPRLRALARLIYQPIDPCAAVLQTSLSEDRPLLVFRPLGLYSAPSGPFLTTVQKTKQL